jgi:hypothetical protein
MPHGLWSSFTTLDLEAAALSQHPVPNLSTLGAGQSRPGAGV